MTAVTDDIIKVLADEGVTLRAYDDELSCPEYPEGSIEWTEFYESRKIGEKTGFSPKMYAYVDVSGVGITSIISSASIAYDPENPKGFVSEVKETMEKFYLSL